MYTTNNAELDNQLYRRFDDLRRVVSAYIPNLNTEKLIDAFQFAAEAHAGVMRKDGSPYITHPLETAIILTDMAMDLDSVIAALLHDVLEDTDVTFATISKRFGKSVAELVDGVTKLTRMPFTTKEEHQTENLRKMLLAMSKDIRVLIIKIADRLHNMRTIQYHNEKKRREKCIETIEIYAPLAYRLGINKVKYELEDRSLEFLDPAAYEDIENQLKNMRREKGDFLSQAERLIKKRMKETGLESDVYSRVKSTYSIYRKMYASGEHKMLHEIYDIYAVRVIVHTVAECYNALGMMHDLFQPMPGRFKDYISNAKPNGYQSLHTTIIGHAGVPFEVQIRTHEMHYVAEYGIAAHWKYKSQLKTEPAQDRLKWIRMLLETQDIADAEEFIRAFKVDLFADQVFVFTPRGDVINLPQGSTPVDFAYSIHSAVGNRMTGARVNGHIVPLDHQFQTGDIVEVISHGGSGPKRDWLRIAKTSEARNKIKQWFKKEKREENIAQGRAMLSDELRRAGVPVESLDQDDAVAGIMRKMSFASLDDLCGAIGYGGISAQRAANRIRDELVRLNHLQSEKQSAERAIDQMKRTPLRAAANRVNIEGMDNFDVKFAKCCLPVPGDEIMGFITRGFGISVHNLNCKNVQTRTDSELGRWVSAQWDNAPDTLFETGVRVLCNDRDGLANDVSGVLRALKIPMTAFSARVLEDGRSMILTTLKVKDLEQLAFVISKLRQVSDVTEIERCGA